MTPPVTFRRFVRSSLRAVLWSSTPMVQYANYPGLLTRLPIVEAVLDHHASELGCDLIAYQNHVYRIVNLCVAILGDRRVELEKRRWWRCLARLTCPKCPVSELTRWGKRSVFGGCF